MANTENTFHMSKEQHRKMGSRTSARHDGDIPKDSEAAFMQSVIDKERSKSQITPKLEHPDLPDPNESDIKHADPRHTGTGIGGRVEGHAYKETQRSPTTQASAVRLDGKEWHKETAL